MPVCVEFSVDDFFSFFFFNDTATTEIYTLSLHDALPISGELRTPDGGFGLHDTFIGLGDRLAGILDRKSTRLNSSHSQISYAVFCLKKKKYPNTTASVTSTPCPSSRHSFSLRTIGHTRRS